MENDNNNKFRIYSPNLSYWAELQRPSVPPRLTALVKTIISLIFLKK